MFQRGAAPRRRPSRARRLARRLERAGTPLSSSNRYDTETQPWPTRPSQARLRHQQHAPRRLQRSGRPLRRRADHGASRLRLYRPHLLEGLLRRRRARSRPAPKYVKYVAAPPNTWTLHLQAFDDLLLVVHNKDMFAQARARRREELLQGLRRSSREGGSRRRATGRPAWRSTTFRSPTIPSRSASCRSRAPGLHRLWYVGGRWAYASALLDGFSDYILITIDMAGPEEAGAGRQVLAAGHERRGRREGELADQERSLRAPSRHHPRRHRLLQLARRLPRRRRRQGQGQSETHRPQESGRRRSAAARTTRCRCPSAICSSSSTRRCSTIRRTASSRSGSSTIR